jgi:hypothetical protein
VITTYRPCAGFAGKKTSETPAGGGESRQTGMTQNTQEETTMKSLIHYTRYILCALASVGYGSAIN